MVLVTAETNFYNPRVGVLFHKAARLEIQAAADKMLPLSPRKYE